MRRPASPRLIATLGLFALSATFFCAIIGYVVVNRADDRQEVLRRMQLVAAIEDIRNSGTDPSELDTQFLSGLARTIGLKDLRFENELSDQSREVQPALDNSGRILGWFTWQRDDTISQALTSLEPMLMISAFGLIGFAGLALWQVRRSMRAFAASEQLAWQFANEDSLTGLPNQRKTVELIEALLPARAPGEVVTLAIIDIDGLNVINDGYGRQMGDAVLASFAERLRQTQAQFAGRIGDDEFVLALISGSARDSWDEIAEIAKQLTRPYWLGEQAVQIGVTIGLAHAVSDSLGGDDLMRCADLALREAKRKNRGGMVEFRTAMAAEFSERQFIERELRRAIADNALDLHYQPIMTADGAYMTGVEALLRWNHPERGDIPPGIFVPVAERTGLMVKLGEWVLRRALTDAARWPELSIAINLSPVQVRDPALVKFVVEVLTETRISPSRVVLEMTEGVLIENPDEARRRLDGLHSIGVQLALDDFGSGYSSLTYLQRFHFDKLKIDQGFVQSLGHARGSEAIIQAIVGLGRALNLSVTAEGVETEEQRVLLRLAGCDEMQGYLFARPGSRESIDRLLAERIPATKLRPRSA